MLKQAIVSDYEFNSWTCIFLNFWEVIRELGFLNRSLLLYMRHFIVVFYVFVVSAGIRMTLIH